MVITNRMITLYKSTKKGLIAVLKSKYSATPLDLIRDQKCCSPHCPWLSKPYWDPPYAHQTMGEAGNTNNANRDCLKFHVALEDCVWTHQTNYQQTHFRCKECLDAEAPVEPVEA